MTLEEEIARVIDKAFDDWQGEESETAFVTARLAPLLNRVRAEAQAEVQRLHAVMGRGFVEALRDRDEAYAELRQERERVSVWKSHRNEALDEEARLRTELEQERKTRKMYRNAWIDTEATLSRAEETIDRIKVLLAPVLKRVDREQVGTHGPECHTRHLRCLALATERALTEYGKQKGAKN